MGNGSNRQHAGAGFMLVEVVVTIAILGLLAVPLANLLITTIRTTDAAERRLERVGLAQVAAGVASRAAVSDECVPDEYQAAVAARVALGATQVAISADCSALPVVLTIVVTDERGDTTTVLAVRP